MRILILGVSAIALSGCSWLGLGGNNQSYNKKAQTGNYNYGQKTAPKSGCHSGQCLSRWNLEAAVGPTFNVGGNAVTGSRAHEGSDLDNIDFSEAYRPGIRGELGGSYALNPNRKITGNVFYEQAESDGAFDWGTVGTQELRGSLSDYESYGAEIGLRQYFAPRRGGAILGNYRPYVEGRVGATRLSSVDVQGATLGGTALADDIAFYESGWVGSAAGLVGVETPIARHTTIALESGIRYTQKPGTDTSQILGDSPLAGTNNGGSRYSIPVMLRGRYRFQVFQIIKKSIPAYLSRDFF